MSFYRFVQIRFTRICKMYEHLNGKISPECESANGWREIRLHGRCRHKSKAIAKECAVKFVIN
uniref:Uncharacterized protein n=1 Tax=Anguilla anguilla TaxID=7936 RepID=A0A0E9QGL5_ANGAN